MYALPQPITLATNDMLMLGVECDRIPATTTTRTLEVETVKTLNQTTRASVQRLVITRGFT